MTREELKAHCEREIEMCEFWAINRGEKLDSNKIYQEHKLILKLLEQEPCEDCISRQAVLDAFHTWFRDGFDEDKWWNSTHVLAVIEGLPPVQQEHKWETCFECPLSYGCPKIKGCTNEQAIEYASQIPNNCPYETDEPAEHYCSGCGAKMKGSEDKE